MGAGRGGNVGGGAVVAPPPNSPPTVTSVQAIVGGSPPKPMPTPTPSEDDRKQLIEEQRRAELQQKMHRSVQVVVDKLRKNEALSSADEAGFIRNGKAEVQVWLSEKSDEALAKLKELGFEVILDNKASKLIIGRLPIDKLETLAGLKFVRYVSPQVTK